MAGSMSSNDLCMALVTRRELVCYSMMGNKYGPEFFHVYVLVGQLSDTHHKFPLSACS